MSRLSDNPEADDALRALLTPHLPAIDQATFRLAPLLSPRSSPTAVREALESLALDVLRLDRLRRGSGPVPETAGKDVPVTPVVSPKPAIERHADGSVWPEQPRHPRRPRRFP